MSYYQFQPMMMPKPEPGLLGPVKPRGPPRRGKGKKGNKSKALAIELKSPWTEISNDAMMQQLTKATKHGKSDLQALPNSLPMKILGVKNGGNPYKNPKKSTKTKSKTKPIPREERVFLRCPGCEKRVHVRRIICPICKLSKADSSKRKVYAAG